MLLLMKKYQTMSCDMRWFGKRSGMNIIQRGQFNDEYFELEENGRNGGLGYWSQV